MSRGKMKYPVFKSIALLLPIIAVLMVSVAPLYSQTETVPDTIAAQKGLDILPPDIRSRWISLRDQAYSDQAQAYLQEGEHVLAQLGRLSESVGNRTPEPGTTAYTIFTNVLNKLIELLDRIELAVVLEITDINQLEQLLNEYQAERDDLAREVRSERQKLIDLGGKSIEQQLRDPYFRKFPHRRSVIANLYFRMAELVYQETREKFLDEQMKYMDDLNELSQTDPARAAQLKPPVPNYRRVLSMYQHIIDEFPDTPYGVDALYNIAILTGESNDPKDKTTSNQYFETLVRLYPGNQYTLNALQRIGEYYFLPPVNNIDKAIAVYQRIVKDFSDTEYYPDALFMLGWCYYRVSNLPGAVEAFAMTLDEGYDDDGYKRPVSVRDLGPESMKYISICFSVELQEWENAGVDNFVLWLQSNPDRLNRYGTDLLIALGDVFTNELGRHNEAILAYTSFLEMFPLEPRAPLVHLKVLNLFRSGQVYDLERTHLETVAFYDNYNPDTEWWQANVEPETREDLIPLLEAYLDTVITDKLIFGSDSGEMTHYEAYERYSRQYLRFWPQGPNAYRIHYYLATVLAQNLSRPMDALKEYWPVATMYNDTTYKEISAQQIAAISRQFVKQEKAGEIFVSAEGEILPPSEKVLVESDTLAVEAAEPDTATAQAEETIQRTDLLNSEALQLAAYDHYIANFPTSALTPTMLYQSGSILFDHDMIPESRPYLEQLIADFPENQTLEDAYTLLLGGYFKSKDVPGVEMIDARIQLADVSDELKAASSTRKSASIYRNASEMVASEDHIGAAEEFMRVAIETPASEHADKSLFLAGQEFSKGEEYLRSNEAYMMLVDRYTDSDLIPKALNNVGFNLQNELVELAQAAVIFERLAVDFPTNELSQLALANASFNYNEVKDHLSAIRINELYIERYPDEEDASTYLFENAGHYLNLDDVSKANDIYRRFAERFPDDPRTVQAHFERGQYALENNNRREAETEYNLTVAAHERHVAKGLSGSPKYAALALGQLLDWEHAEYSKLEFTLPESNITAKKARMVEWRDSLIGKYQKLIQLGQKEGYRSFYEIGRLVEEQALATVTQEMPDIRDLTAKLDALNNIVTDAIGLNASAVANYKEGRSQLSEIEGVIKTMVDDRQTEFDKFSEIVSQMELDTAAVGIADSLEKLSNMRRMIAEADSALTEAQKWIVACSEKIPEVAARDGDYLGRLWYEQLAWRSNERDSYIRMMLQQGWLNNVIKPLTPEVAGLYLQAVITTMEIPENEAKWLPILEEKYSAVVDTMLSHYGAQVAVARGRYEMYTQQYQDMLPEGEDANSPEGYYPDEMGDLILEQIDYWNTFSIDLMSAHQLILDTTMQYELPPGFGDAAKSRILDFALEQYSDLSSAAARANDNRDEYAVQYEETSELHWDDAVFAHEDIIFNLNDYAFILLEEGFAMKQDYMLVGLAGVNILKELVTLKPDLYASVVGIEPKRYQLTTSNDWLVWPVFVPGFETVEYDDSAWENVTMGEFPYDAEFGMLDSLDADPIWYFRSEPPKGPEWVTIPDTIHAYEGVELVVEIKGTAPDESMLTISFNSENLPLDAWFSDDMDGAGTLNWRPTFEDAGEYLCEFVLTDGEFAVKTEVPVIVQNMERAMEWVDVPDEVFVEEGSIVEFTVTGVDPENKGDLVIAYESADLPETAGFTDYGDGSGMFTWESTFEDSGSYAATFSLTNDDTTIAVLIPIIIGNVNHEPAWVDIPMEIQVTTEELIEFVVSFEDEDGDPVSITYFSEYIPVEAIFTDNGDGTASFSWLPGEFDEGFFIAAFTISDGDLSNTAEVSISVGAANRPPMWIGVPETLTAGVDEFVDLLLTAEDPESATLVLGYHSDDMPPEAEFTDYLDGTGAFNWMPTEADLGTFTAVFTASDGDMESSASIYITVVAGNVPPSWVEVPETMEGTPGEPLEFTVIGQDPEGADLTIGYSSEYLPVEAIFTDNLDGSGSFTWTPTEIDEGSYTALFVISDGELETGAEVSIFIGAGNRPPAWTDVPESIDGIAGEQLEFTIIGQDPEGAALTIAYNSDNMPVGATFNDNFDGTGIFNWMPTEADEGSFTANFTLSDGELEAEAIVSIFIGAGNRPPVWTDVPESIDGTAGEQLVFTIIGQDPEGAALTIAYSSDNMPAEATFNDNFDGTGIFNWMPSDADEGSFTANFTLSDGELEAEAIVSIFIGAGNRPPIWTQAPEVGNGVTGELLEFELISEDPEGDPLTITFASDNLPLEAVFNDNFDGSGIFSWTPGESDAGSFEATFTVSDGELESSMSIPIYVEAGNQPPNWINISENVEATAGELIEFTVQGEDPEGGELSITMMSEDLPDEAVLTDNGDGTGFFVWQPTTDDVGSFTIVFTLQDAEFSTEATVEMTVSPAANKEPEWIEIPESVDLVAGEEMNVTLIAQDPDGDAITISYSSFDLPDAVQFTDNENGTGILSWIPVNDDAGNYLAEFTVSDGEMNITGEISINVTATANQAPMWSMIPEAVEANAGDLVEISVMGDDFDGDDLTIYYSSFEIPDDAVEFTDNGDGTGALKWQTTSEDVGTFTVIFTLTDGVEEVMAQVIVTVIGE